MDEPDWTQVDATRDQIIAWMSDKVNEYSSAEELARAAFNHFSRPYHLRAFQKWSSELWKKD